jgi:hypothetical protein
VPAGTYDVTLKFAEIFFTQPGQRVFDIVINGTVVQPAFDIVAQAGGGAIALDKTYTVGPTSQITISFNTITNFPAVNAIAIAPTSGLGVGINPSTVTLTASQAQQFTATVTGTSNTAVNWTVTPSGLGTFSTNGNTATYTAPPSITTAQQVTVKATSVADNTKSAQAVITLSPTGAFSPIRVHAGGSAFTDPATGNIWSADTGFSGGTPFGSGGAVTDTANPSQAPLYQSERYGDFQYQFNVPSGTYTVNLKFAEIYWTQPGQRIFNVTINGQTVLNGFDIVAAAGGGFIAVDKPFTVGPTTQITIGFTSTVDNAEINAIEILSGTAPVGISMNPVSAALTASQTQDFTATVTGTTNTGVTWVLSPSNVGSITTAGNTATYKAPATITTSQQVTLTATSVADNTKSAGASINLTPAGTFSPIRVHAGGAAFTDSATGNVWSADTGFTGGSAFATGSTVTDTANPSQAPLYQSQRYGNFQYQFNVPSGTYTVNLKFAEIWWTQTGQRVFNVTINGQTVLSGFDIVAAAGGAFQAVDRAFTVGPTTQITIGFTSTVDNAEINAIEILSGSTAVGVSVSPPTAALTASQSQMFTATVTGTTNTVANWTIAPSGVGTFSTSGNTATYTAPATITTMQTVTITATSAADTTKSASATVTLSPPSATPIRVNAGGSAFTDSATGNVWSTDTGFSGGATFSTTTAVTNTANPTQAPLYQSERYGNFQYQFNVPNATHTVTLKFAELFWTAVGQRVFNVVINGQTVLTNFDIFSAAGGQFKAIDKTFTIPAASQITIQFVTVTDNAKVDAIQIQ